MKKLLSVQYSAGAFNFAVLLLRLGFGIIMLANHGLDKLMNFSEIQNRFYSFMGMGPKFSLVLAIFAEVFCSMFVVLGLFTRLAVVPLIITMLVAIFGANATEPLLKSEVALLYLTAYIVLLFVGPGRISIDGMMKG